MSDRLSRILEQVNSVYPEHESLETEKKRVVKTRTHSEIIPFHQCSRGIPNKYEELALESTSRILANECKAAENYDRQTSVESIESCVTNKHTSDTEFPYKNVEYNEQDEDEDELLNEENTEIEPECSSLVSEVTLIGKIQKTDFKEFISYANQIEENSQEDLCLISQEDELEEISLANTTEDYHTTSKVAKDTTQIQTY